MPVDVFRSRRQLLKRSIPRRSQPRRRYPQRLCVSTEAPKEKCDTSREKAGRESIRRVKNRATARCEDSSLPWADCAKLSAIPNMHVSTSSAVELRVDFKRVVV